MEKFSIRIFKEDKITVQKTIQLYALQFEPPFANKLQCKLKDYIDENGKEHVVHIDLSSRNVNVIASANLRRVGFYATVATVTTFKNHKLKF
tara:strand:- start:319 stop:594 length:276 start_codon:yes stop_codon:yes gene_type:complete